jgi:hypothetical protein
MPKRSNAFQRLVYHIHKVLAAPNVVAESHFLSDRISGQKREVDIVVTVPVSTYSMLISVECVATGRKASIEWVERMIGKHRNLPTNKLILVAQAGFTKAAAEKARSSGITTYTLAEAIAADWTQIAGKLDTLFFSRYDFKPSAFAIQIADGGDEWFQIGSDVAFVDGTGTAVATCKDVAHHILNQHALASAVMGRMDRDGQKQGNIDADPPAGWYAFDTNRGRHAVTKIRIFLSVERKTAPITMKSASWDDTPVAYGSAKTAFGPTDLSILEPKPGALSGFASFPDPSSGQMTAYPLRKPLPPELGPRFIEPPPTNDSEPV